MKILYYTWNEATHNDMSDNLIKLGHDVTIVEYQITDYAKDESFYEFLKGKLNESKYDFIFTFNYFPVISTVAKDISIPYICWVYDCPHYTLFSPTVTNESNYIFTFDKAMEAQLNTFGAKHVYHMPLAVNTARIQSN